MIEFKVVSEIEESSFETQMARLLSTGWKVVHYGYHIDSDKIGLGRHWFVAYLTREQNVNALVETQASQQAPEDGSTRMIISAVDIEFARPDIFNVPVGNPLDAPFGGF